MLIPGYRGFKVGGLSGPHADPIYSKKEDLVMNPARPYEP